MKLVAVRHLDGTVVKGTTADFKPACLSFHVRTEDGTITALNTDELKAVFFIKTIEGDSEHDEQKDFGSKSTPEKKVWIEFKDGEELAGWSSSFASGKGFFFTPTDPASNLQRAYVFKSAVRRVLDGPEAERAAAERESRPASGVGPMWET